MNAIVFGGLLVVVLVSTAGVLIQRSITVPLAAFMQFVGRVGEGDLTHKAKISSADELGELAQHLDQMVAGLKDVAGQTRLATQNLNSASSEILASTQQQAASMVEQASAIQQTTTTMEEVKQSGAQISERAKQVAASAEATSAASHTGLQAVENTARTMETIREQAEAVAGNVVSLSEKTQAIGEIIAAVNDLAEQSNLLAVNAAIEAAKAGEQGRGFAVVAQEIKGLAEQSKQATAQVRAILNDVQKATAAAVLATEQGSKAVETGVKQSGEAGETIRSLANSIIETTQAATQIAASSQQQLVGTDQVAMAMENIKQATAQNVAGAEQAEKAAQNLHELGQKLKQMVEQYKV